MKKEDYLQRRAQLQKVISDAKSELNEIEESRYKALLAEMPYNKDKPTKVLVTYTRNMKDFTEEMYIGGYRLHPIDGEMEYTFYQVKKDGTMSSRKNDISSWWTVKTLSITIL